MTILFPDSIIYDSPLFSIAQDREVPIVWFFIIAPVRQVRSIADFTDDEATEFIYILRRLRQGMRDLLHIEDVYLFQNEDTDHNFHLRVFPRHDWMESHGRKIQSVRPIMEYAVQHLTTPHHTQLVKDAAAQLKGYFTSN